MELPLVRGIERMKTVVYEKLEDFISVLKSIEMKQTPVYISLVKGKKTEADDEYRFSAKIQMQVPDGDFVRTYIHTDMPEIAIIPDYFFKVIRDEKFREMIRKDYVESLAVFDSLVETEYKKMLDVLGSLGYTFFVNAVVV